MREATTSNAMKDHQSISVSLGARGYEIVLGSGVLDRAGELMAPILARPRVAVVTDRNTAVHLPRLKAALDRARIVHDEVVLPSGETTKDFAHLEALIDRLLAGRIERSTALIALGGGVIGDLTGFAASIVLRGIDFVQIPTTLLAQVDSSIGGKTGINTGHGKNLVGSFHQPRLVIADLSTLDTLPPREFLAGYAEIVKYGLLGDAEFFDWLEAHGESLIEGDASARLHAVAKSCRAKAAIVAEDEREAGQRALLNLGHTFAHAFEAETGFGAELLHGEAVALGMVMAFDLSVRLGHCAPEDATRVRRHLTAVGLPTELTRGDGRRWDAGALLDHMARDKKVRDGKVTFVLARGIGRAFVAHDVAREAVRELLDDAVAA
ncbi:MAG TPA: 3-dehydroquinate synthase [Alphaproteobacteria bacterium]|nr:3-dehydroquinate synthase [Alphaproteobacteria bacterium]